MKHKYLLTEEMKRPTYELGYVIGAYLGDGSYSWVEKKTSSVSLEVTEIDFINYYVSNLKKIYPYKISVKTRKRNGRKFFIASFYTRQFCKFIIDFNVNNIFNLPLEFKKAFLRGIYDAEGHVMARNLDNLSKANRGITFTQKDEEIVRLVRRLLDYFNIRYNVHKRDYSGFKEHCVHSVIYIFGYDNLLMFYNLIGFGISRKMNNLKRALDSYLITRKCIECNKQYILNRSGHKSIRCAKCSFNHFNRYHRDYRYKIYLKRMEQRETECLDCGKDIKDKLLVNSNIMIKRCNKCQSNYNIGRTRLAATKYYANHKGGVDD